MLGASMWGCTTPEEATQANTADTSSTAPAAKDPKDIVIGLSMQTLSAPYFVAQENAVKKKCEELGVKCVSMDAQGDVNKQIAGIEDLIAQTWI